MAFANFEISYSLIVNRRGADLAREFDHLRNKRIEVVRAPRHEKLHGLGLRALDRTQHDITEIQQSRALGDDAYAHAGVNERHNGMNLGQLLDVVRRDAGLGEQISDRVAKIISFVR